MAQAPIITFYSYKGGTGRSMGLANTAWILASNGMRVLAVDWDLEAPGLHRFFHPFLPDRNLGTSSGVIDLMWEFATSASDPQMVRESGWHEGLAAIEPYTMSVEYPFPRSGTIDLVPAGRQNHLYATLVTTFDWTNFYEHLGGGGFLEALKRNMRAEYDYVLIDSRTGLSDTAGICTVQMPDILVDCFSLSTQAIDGAVAVAGSVHRQRQGEQLRVFPVPMRVEDGEQDKLEASRDYARARFGPFLSHVPDPERYWGEVEVPYRRFYAYEEILATIGDRPQQDGTILAVTERIVGYLTGEKVTKLGLTMTEAERRRLLALFQRGRNPESGVADHLPGANAPRVFMAFAYDSADQFEAVRSLWYLLRSRGIDARLDRAPGQRQPDWPLWLADELRQAQFVLLVASPGYGEQAGQASPVRDAYSADPRRFLGVVLPGGSGTELATFAVPGTLDVVSLTALTAAGIEPLLGEIGRRLPAPKPGYVPGQGIPEAPRPQWLHGEVEPSFANVTDALSQVAMEHWKAEATARGISDPFPLPVRWSNARKQASAETAAQAPDSGIATELADVLMRLPRGRLVLLGAPGSGKTTAAMMLTLDILDRRARALPVPVLVPFASWDPNAENVEDWLVRRLRTDYQVVTSGHDESAVRQLIRTGWIVPVLDGLDELPATSRAAAISAIDRHSPVAAVVVTSRTAEYDAVVGNTGRALSGAAVLELAPLSLADARAFLSASAIGDDHRWQQFFAELGEDSDAAVAHALRSPLMVWLARESYRSPATDPAELLALPDEAAIERQLADALIPACYDAPSPMGSRLATYSPGAARRWLTSLARSMLAARSQDLAWWRLPETLSSAQLGSLLGVVSMLLVAVTAPASYWITSLLAGPAYLWLAPIAVLAAIAAVAGVTAPTTVPRPETPLWWLRLSRLRPSPWSGAYSPPDDPIALIGSSRRTALALIVAPGLGAGVAVASWAHFADHWSAWLGVGSCAAALAMALAVPWVLRRSAWARYLITRIWLAARGLLPFGLFRFLADAQERGLLRRVGAVYQFRYAALADLLAEGSGSSENGASTRGEPRGSERRTEGYL